MKKRELLLASLTLLCLIVVSISFFKVYASAKRRLDQVLVENVTFDASAKEVVTKEALLAAAHVNKIPRVTKVDVPNLEFIQNMQPGIYEVPIKVYIQFDEVITRQITVRIVDQTKPIIKQKKDLVIPRNTKIDWADYFSIHDAIDGPISLETSKISVINRKKVGKQTVVISAKDKAGNTAKKEVTVEIVSSKHNQVEESRQQSYQNSLKKTTAPNTAKPLQEESKGEPSSKPEVKADLIPQNKLKSVIQFNGQTISYSHATGANSAPDEGAATWLGKGLVDDSAPTHFIGHNPGDFATVMELYVGAPITVYDDNGKQKTYHVYEVVDVTDEGYNANDLKDDVLPRMLDEKGERISLQTCINDHINRCVLAR